MSTNWLNPNPPCFLNCSKTRKMILSILINTKISCRCYRQTLGTGFIFSLPILLWLPMCWRRLLLVLNTFPQDIHSYVLATFLALTCASSEYEYSSLLYCQSICDRYCIYKDPHVVFFYDHITLSTGYTFTCLWSLFWTIGVGLLNVNAPAPTTPQQPP